MPQLQNTAGRENSIRLGVVGLGNIWNWQEKSLGLSPRFILVAAADHDPTKAMNIPNSIPFFPDHRGILSIQALDAILISTSVNSHFEIARDALSRGIPVLLEKPATTCYSDLKELYSIASSNRSLLVIAYHAAFALDVRWAEHYIHQGQGSALGPITSAWSGFFDPYASEEDPHRRFRSLGGSWMDSGVNALSVLATFTDLSAIEVSNSVRTTLPPYESDARTIATMIKPASTRQFPRRIVIETNWLLGSNHKSTILTFETSGSYIHLDHTRQTVSIFKCGRRDQIEDCSRGRDRLVNQYVGVFEDFANRLDGFIDNRERSLQIHRLLFDAQHHSGRSVDAGDA
jgi:predicted dehydrogenase